MKRDPQPKQRRLPMPANDAQPLSEQIQPNVMRNVLRDRQDDTPALKKMRDGIKARRLVR